MIKPNSHNLGIPACRFCKHYTPEGRRGGVCSILQSSVAGSWQACPLSAPFFSDHRHEANQGSTLEHEFMVASMVSSIVHISNNSNNLGQN